MLDPGQIGIPSSRKIQQLLRQLPIRNWGRPSVASDARFWSGIGIGIGVGSALCALVNPRTGPETRMRIREGFEQARERLSLPSGGTSEIEESIVVEVPAQTAYNQWTQFEDFPRFMQGVSDVQQINDRRLHWKAEIAGRPVEWDAEIVEQIPDKRIAWRNLGDHSVGGGVVTFHRLSDDACQIMIQMKYQPQDSVERIGDSLGLTRRRIRGDLDRFQDFIERRGEPTGEFREQIE